MFRWTIYRRCNDVKSYKQHRSFIPLGLPTDDIHHVAFGLFVYTTNYYCFDFLRWLWDFAYEVVGKHYWSICHKFTVMIRILISFWLLIWTTFACSKPVWNKLLDKFYVPRFEENWSPFSAVYCRNKLYPYSEIHFFT